MAISHICFSTFLYWTFRNNVGSYKYLDRYYIYAFRVFYNKVSSYLKQKELENDPHYIEGINDAVWWEEDDD